jgi:hypothetical protein
MIRKDYDIEYSGERMKEGRHGITDREGKKEGQM